MSESLAWTFIDSPESICHMLNTFKVVYPSEAPIYVNLKGINISRQGCISTLQLYMLPLNHVYMVDVYTLQGQAFYVTASDGVTSIKTILESDSITKAFFDVRKESDALFAHFNVRLAGVHDIQLMELATRTGSRRFIDGLSRCIEKDAHLSWDEQKEWRVTTDKGLFKILPERGGRHEAFNERPLAPELVWYCVCDIRFFPKLYSHYRSKLSGASMSIVNDATRVRIASTQAADYDSTGRHMALGPGGW